METQRPASLINARRMRAIATAWFAAMSLSACATTIDSRSLGVETSLASDARDPAVGQRFKIDKKAVYMFWGLTQPGKPSLNAILGGQVQGDQKIADLSIKVRSTFIDVLLSIVTVGIVVPRSMTFEGVVVQGNGN